MIRALKKVMYRKFSRIGETAFILSLFTFLSQIFALIRDRLLTGRVGAGTSLDIYYAAFRIPDIVFVVTASLVSVSILMPYFREQLQKGEGEARNFFNGVFSFFILLVFSVNIFVFFLIPHFSRILFSGFSPESLEKVILLSRIMLLSPVLLGVSNLFSTIVQSSQRFLVFALAPLFYNLGIIFGILFFYPMFGILGLAMGVIVGAFLHLAIQYKVVHTEGYSPHFSLKSIRWEVLKEIIKNSLPRTLTLSTSRILFLTLIALASTFVAGSVSLFQLSFNLQSVPLSLIGVAYSVAAFPVLVSYFQEGKMKEFTESVFVPIRQIIFWSLPAITLFIILRAHIVRVVLGTKNFSWADTRITAASLAILVFAILAQGINFVFIRAYYAAGKTWRPFLVSSISFFLTIPVLFLGLSFYQKSQSFRFILEKLMKVSGLRGTEVLLLALAYLVAMYSSLALFSFFFLRDFPESRRVSRGFGIMKSFFQSLGASLFFAISLYISLHASSSFFNQNRAFSLLFHALFASIFPVMLWFAMLLYLENQDFIQFRDRTLRILRSIFKNLRSIQLWERDPLS